MNLSLSLSLSRVPFVRKRDDKHAQNKKSAGLRKRVHTRIQFYPPLPKEKERYIFCSDDDEDVPVGENVFVHILRSTLRQIDVRALLLHFLSPGLKYEEEETANKDRFGRSRFVGFLFHSKACCSEKFLAFCLCVLVPLFFESLGGKGSLLGMVPKRFEPKNFRQSEFKAFKVQSALRFHHLLKSLFHDSLLIHTV